MFYCLLYNKRIVYKQGKLKMEQQKTTTNIQPNSQSNLNIADISNTYQKTLRSLHNISNSNIKSKSKLFPPPQFVISYNFQNDPNCQVRTHNLLIGLDQVVESHPKKNTFRKNAHLRVNNFSNSHSNFRNSRNESEHLRNKLIHVRSNQILSSKHNHQDTTAQSFSIKNDKTKINLKSSAHSNTFWNNERPIINENTKNHEKYINSNVVKIGSRKSINKNKADRNVYTNSIQKISRNKIGQIDKNMSKYNQVAIIQSSHLYELPDGDILEKDQSVGTSKLPKKHDEYNQKLQKILRKVKREATRQSLKEAYIKKQANMSSQQKDESRGRNSTNKISPSRSSVGNSKIGKDLSGKKSIIKNTKPLVQYQNTLPIKQNYNQELVRKFQCEDEQGSRINNQRGQIQDYEQIQKPLQVRKGNPAQRQISYYQKRTIEKENAERPKRNYQKLLKNSNIKKVNTNSLAQEFHRIESQNQNQVGSSKKHSKQQIIQSNHPEKSIDYSINEHLNQNSSNQKENKLNIQPQVRDEGLNLEQLKFNRSKDGNVEHGQSSFHNNSDKRTNYHAPTSFQKQKNGYRHQRPRFNSNLDCKSDHLNNQIQLALTKRKVPADYKQFLRLLSEENQRKKSIQEMERQRELSLCANKTSRFHNLEAQKQHIQRIITPIGNSFMEQRRKKLSDSRKNQTKPNKSNPCNIDGSIVESDSQASDQSLKNGQKRKQTKKSKYNSLQQNLNAQSKSKSKKQNFRQSLYNSVQVKKGQIDTNQKNSKLNNEKKVDQFKSKAKMNQFQTLNKSNDLSADSCGQEEQDLSTRKKQSSKIQKLTGIKVPQKAIERSNSKQSKMRKMPQNNINTETKTNYTNKLQHQMSLNKKNRVIQQERNSQSQGTFYKNNITKNTNQQHKQQRQIHSIKNGKTIMTKLDQDKKIKPIDKRVAKQKERNFKNWRNGQNGQKKQKLKGPYVQKSKTINSKQWKSPQKNKNKNHQTQNDIKDFEQQVEEKGLQTKKNQKIKNTRKADSAINDLQNKVQNIDSQEVDKVDDESDGNKSQNLQISQDKQNFQQNSLGEVVKIQQAEYQNEQNLQKKDLIPSIHNNVQKNLKSLIGNQNIDKQGDEIPSNLDSQYLTGLNRISVKSGIMENLPSQNILEQQNQNIKVRPTKQSAQNPKENFKKQIKEEKKKEMIQNVLQNEQMQENGFMQITQSKFQIYNNESEKSLASVAINQIQQMDFDQLNKRAQIVRFLYSLPSQYQQEVDKFLPNQNQERLLTSTHFVKINTSTFKQIKAINLRTALEQLAVFDTINIKTIESNTKSKHKTKTSTESFIKKILEPFQNLNGQIGFWLYCVGIWRLITVHRNDITLADKNKIKNWEESFLLLCLQTAFEKALKSYYFGLSIEDIQHQEILRMLTGLKICILAKSKGKSQKIFRQIQYNTRKSHIIRAISSSQSKFSKQTINCVRKIQNTPTGQKVLQIVSTSINQIQSKPKYFWIREDKFLEFFTSFTIISKRNTHSYWTNDSIDIKNQQKAVYMIESTQKHTSGSITLYPFNPQFQSNQQKCTIAFYKEVEPQVLKLVGKAIQRLPEGRQSTHTSKLYFEFNIKGTYYVFLQLENGLYNVSIESNTSQTRLDFVEFVKKQTMKNDQCQYVQIDKIFKKKPNMNTFQNSNEFKQLLNFMKKTSPQVYQAK